MLNKALDLKEGEFQRLVKKIFPYPRFRPFQLDAIKFSFDVFKSGKIGLLSSPCGTGKSISVLTAFFMARELEKSLGRLLVLTRTRNQLEIYSRELKNIKRQSGVSFVASIFKSKKEMCLYTIKDPRLGDINYRDFLRYCKNLKEGAFGEVCNFYERTLSGWKPSWRAKNIVNHIIEVGPLLPDEVYKICCEKELCPYEVTKILARHADIIIGNYNYILVDSIRGSILGRAGIRVKDVNCVFDEAHSLPYYAAGIFSDELSSTSIRRALKECKIFNLDDFGILDTLNNVMIKLGKDVYKKYGADVEHIIEGKRIVNALSKNLGVNTDRLRKNVLELLEVGELVRQRKVESGKSPVSYVSRCADFLLDWINLEGLGYAKYVKVEVAEDERKRVRLGIRCLDPALASSIINNIRSVILMSGTLWCADYYVDVLEIERNRCSFLELPSPFPPENRLLIVDRAVTTKFEKRGEEQWKKIAEHLTKIIHKAGGRVAVYFPSYELMHEIAKLIKPDLPLLVEEKTTNIRDVLSFMGKNEQCLIFGVARGKVSEGVDMTDEGRSMLSAVIIVGLPYPKKTELQIALYKYFKGKFGDKAMEYANDIPCLNALAQCAGRLLRSPEDRGIILIMDGRAAGRFKQKLPQEWRKEMKARLRIEKILDEIENFHKK